MPNQPSPTLSAPATPPHRSSSPHSALQVTPTPTASGLLTPPQSVCFHGRTRPSGDLNYDPPHQPSFSAPASPATPSSLSAVASPVVVGGSMSSDPFDGVPLETIQHIASLIDSDQDLVHFRQSCRSVSNAIEGDRSSFWRRRFLSKFERPRNFEAKKWNNLQYKIQYQHRRSSLKSGALFKLGKTEPEKKCMRILRDLINDSFSQKKHFAAKYPGMIYEDLNLVAISRFCHNENILRSLLDGRNAPKRRSTGNTGKSEPLLQTLQTVLSPLILSNVGEDLYSFPTSQQAAYSPATKQAIFQGCYGTTVNMDWVLHQINFWKYHFTREAESSLYTELFGIDPADLPQLWNSKLSQAETPSIGKKWKGISAFLDPKFLDLVRKEDGRDDIEDEFSGADNGGVFQDMKIKTCIHDSPANATAMFQDALNFHMPAKRAKTRSGEKDDTPLTEPRTFLMENLGGGGTEGSFRSDGWLSQLPSQNGIPGWQRLTMMKYWMDEDNNIDFMTLWAYEGVMLPGGRVIVGRWWSPDEVANTDEQYSGPCLMWNTN